VVGFGASRQRDARPRLGQRPRHRPAKAATGDRDDRGLSRERRQRYSSSMVVRYLFATTLRLTFSVGVSSPPSWVKSPGSTVNFLILAYDWSCEFFSSTVRATRSTTAGCFATTAGSVATMPRSRANLASSSAFSVINATG